MAKYKQIMLYGIRTMLGTDILEGTDVVCETKQGKRICGTLESADSYTFTIRDMEGTATRLPYEDIKTLIKNE